MEELFYTKLWEAVQLFFDGIHWLFVLVFMIITWLVLEVTAKLLKQKKLDKWVITVAVFALGLILSSLYAYVYDLQNKVDIANLFYSVLMGMVIYKVGIDRLLALIKTRWNKKPE